MTTLTPAMMAAADQAIADISSRLDALVEYARDEVALHGQDRTVVISVITAFSMGQNSANLAALLAVAVDRLAHAGGAR